MSIYLAWSLYKLVGVLLFLGLVLGGLSNRIYNK